MQNNIKIYFIRHGRLDLPYKDHLAMPYEVLDGLASGRLDPPIAPDSHQLFLIATQQLPLQDIDIIYFNNSGKQSVRSEQSAQLIKKHIIKKYSKDIPVIGNLGVKEIDFNLTDLVTPEVFTREGMQAIRVALYRAIISGGPVEQVDHLFERIEQIFKFVHKHHNGNETLLIVSHDFFMRVIDVYLNKTRNPKEVTADDLLKTTLNTYFKGFGVSLDLKTFIRV